ncbi:MAG: sodium:proton exchanger, partial [bacterium]|nr:sodium:proton exchanger [bacterium]
MAGAAVALLVFPDLGVWEAALLAAILSPTDAALGQAVVSNPVVPIRIRQALNVESGLNDGIMLPVITLLLAVAAAGVDLETTGYWTEFAAKQIGYGVLAGAAGGYAGGRLIREFAGRNWMDGAFRQLATLAVGVGSFALAEALGGNGFVAAFVAGLAFGAAARDYCAGVYDFAEDQGQLLALLTFLFFGVALAGPVLDDLTWRIALYAVLSLTVVRMI